MQLSDVVRVLGTQAALGQFPWGKVVCDTVNLFAEPSLRLSLTSTGADLDRALTAMSETNRTLLHNAHLDVNAAGPTVVQDIGGGLVLEHGPDGIGPLLTPKNIVTGSIVGLVVLASVTMMSNLASSTKTDWKEVADALISIVKSIWGL